MNPFQSRLSQSDTRWSNYVESIESKRTRDMLLNISVMFLESVLVTGFLWSFQ